MVSRVTRDGFTIGTNVFYGIAWELGFHRKAFVIYPRNEEGVLRWIDRPTDKAFFAKYVFIPAQTFPARSFIRTAIDAKLPKIREDLGQRIVKKMGEDLPNTFEVTIGSV